MKRMLIFDNPFAKEVFLPRLIKKRNLVYVSDFIVLNVFHWHSLDIPTPNEFFVETIGSYTPKGVSVYCQAHAFLDGKSKTVSNRSMSEFPSIATHLLWKALCVLAGVVLPKAKDPEWIIAYAKSYPRQNNFVLAGVGKGDRCVLSYTIFNEEVPVKINNTLVHGRVVHKDSGILIAVEDGVFVIHPEYMDFSELLDASDLI